MAQSKPPEPEPQHVLPPGDGRSLKGEAPALPWKGPWPKSLDEARAAGADISKYDAQDQASLDRQLRLVDSVEKCLASKGTPAVTGDLLTEAWFNVKGTDATFEEIKPVDSTLPDGVDVQVLDCIQQFHRAGPVRMPGADEGRFVVYGLLHLPLRDDRIYASLLTKN